MSTRLTVERSELVAALEQILSAEVVSLSRRPSPYRTSAAIEELTVRVGDGRRLELVLKDVSAEGLSTAARRAKPLGLHDPAREIEVYRRILAPLGLGTPELVGALVEPDIGRHWLFLERVPGVELYQVGNLELWQAVARWLAGFHTRSRDLALEVADAARLVVYDEPYYRSWLERARRFVTAPAARRWLAWLAARHGRFVDELLALPRTLVHGELYASNVLVVDSHDATRVAPVDWESAGIGPGPVDLAALVAGDWSDEDRRAVVDAYELEGLSRDERARSLDLCRLHLALRALGWSRTWTPPPEHARDWLAEAVAATERLDA
jgi:Ser/Thr protein kinase RdoA (MazF antagonist)